MWSSSRDLKKFLKVKGWVTRSELRTKRVILKDSNFIQTFYLDVEFEYEFMGEVHFGNEFSARQSFFKSREDAIEYLRAFREGELVDVYVLKTDCSIAYLEI